MMSHAINKVAYSFVMDRGTRFAYQAWHLAHSLVRSCGANPTDVHIQCTPEADPQARNLLEGRGFLTHSLRRFGDGQYCNKILQFDNLHLSDHDIVVLLDTDTIAVADLRQWLSLEAITGKIVDAANPPLSVLSSIALAAGVRIQDDVCRTDSNDGDTYRTNCNGGMYGIPVKHCSRLSKEWRGWAEWLLDNIHLLGGYHKHVDQVSFWLALQATGIPFCSAPSNANYFTHMDAPHLYADRSREIALLHYHNSALNVLGLIDTQTHLPVEATRAISIANEQIGTAFENSLFWNFRYECFPERGSGIGSRGLNCEYKRALLREHGIEGAASVLDVGCGDLEVIKPLVLNRYIGIDLSLTAISRARKLMPEAEFYLGIENGAPDADFVLCLEVLIHQPSREAYRRMVQFVSARTKQTLIVSGYPCATDAVIRNPMVFFHEPLEDSLLKTGRFRSVRQIGAHTDVVVYRCDV